MRILEIVHGFPPQAEAGAEIYAERHARALKDHCGDQVTVLTREADASRPEYAIRTETRSGMRILYINNTFRATRSFSDTYRNDALGAVARRVIELVNPQVAHVHHLTCLSTSIVQSLSLRNVPCFYTLHDYWLMCHRGQLLDQDFRVCAGPGATGCNRCVGRIEGASPRMFSASVALREIEDRLPVRVATQVRRVARKVAWFTVDPAEGASQSRERLDHMRTVCSYVTRFLAPSEYIRRRFIEFGVPPERVITSAYGFDHAPFRQLARTSSARMRFGFLGTLMVSKAPDVLLQAFARLPRDAASVTLFGPHAAYHGDERYRSVLEGFLAHPGVRFAGPIAHDRVAEALSEIDVLVVPSIWPENSPLVIREAFLARVPVIASRIGGIPEIVQDGVNGFLVEPGDVDGLYRAMNRLVENPSLLAPLSSRLSAVRTIEEDVRYARELYAAELARRQPQAPMRLAAVVLNYATPIETLFAVKSLLRSRRPVDEIIVVDNSAGGDCREALEGLEPVTCIVSDHNLGFSGGMNLGIRAALSRGAGAVLLVNSDVIVPPDCVAGLERCLRVPGVGIVGPVLRSRSDPRRIASLGMSYEPRTGRMRHIGTGEYRGLSSEPLDRSVDALSGCVMLVKSEVFNEIGLLDEDYFFSFEDLDFCLRARAAGYDSTLAGDTTAYHEGSRSIGADSPRRLYFAARNHLLIASRRSGSGNRIAQLGRSVSIVTLNIAHAVISNGGTLSSRLGAVARGTRDYVAGRYGTD